MMLKFKLNNFLAVLLLVFYTEVVFAKVVNQNDVQKAAENFLERKQYILTKTTIINIPRNIASINELKDPLENQTIAHIAHLTPTGFIILSADTEIEPILAYSFKYNWDGDGGAFHRFLMADLRLRKKALSGRPDQFRKCANQKWRQKLNKANKISKPNSFRQWPPEGMTTTGGWLETVWRQQFPYNNFCPTDPKTNQRSLVGCVATALAQIVNYHKCIGDLRFDSTDSYIADDIRIDADSLRLDFPSFKMMNFYLDGIRYNYKNNLPLDNTSMAALCFACGIVLDMDYSSDASKSFTRLVVSALTTKIKSYNALFLPSTNESFYAFKENIMNALPIQLAVGNSNNGYQHSLAADGYNTDGFYHLNFGWGAEQPEPIVDVWYMLPENIGANFNIVKHGIVDIKPASNIQPEISVYYKRIYFSATHIGEYSQIRTIPLKNQNQESVNIDYIIAAGNFDIAADQSCFGDSIGAMTILPEDALRFFVRSRPDSLGRFRGNIIVSYNAGKNYINIELFGYGVPSGGTIITKCAVSGTWDKEGTPYFILSSLIVENGTCLKISPGVKIIFCNPISFEIMETGQLVAKGNPTDSVIFCAAQADISWKGFCFQNTGIDDTLAYCIIKDVKASENFSAVHIEKSAPTIINSKFTNNEGQFGGALYCNESDIKIQNTLFSNNKSAYGGAIYSNNSSVSLTNVTITNNEPKESGGGIYLKNKNSIRLKNSILWGNRAVQDSGLASLQGSPTGNQNESEIEIEYSDVDTTLEIWIYGKQDNDNNVVWGDGNLCTDPLFTDISKSDYRLSQNSPCIDGGDPADYIENEPLPHGYCLNMGAYGGTRNAAPTAYTSLTVSPNPVDFGHPEIFDTKACTVYLKNGCPNTIHISDIKAINPHNFIVSTYSQNAELKGLNIILEPGKIDSIMVTFVPSASNKQVYNSELIIMLQETQDKCICMRTYSRLQGAIAGILKKENSPFTIDGNMFIPDDASLIIEPGVKVIFKGRYQLQVKARAQLTAIGNSQDSIYFCAENSRSSWKGIQFENSGDDDTLAYCVIKNVSATGIPPFYNASALYLGNSSPAISHCRFSENTLNRGGILYLFQSSPLIQNTVIEQNTLKSAGALCLFRANPRIRNTLICRNTIFFDDAGAVIGQNSCPEMVNLTICNNQSYYSTDFGDLILCGGNHFKVESSIIGGNRNHTEAAVLFRAENADSDLVEFHYSNIDTSAKSWRNTAESTTGRIIWATGNIATPRLFTDVENGDFSLQKNSPCIDAGNPMADVAQEPFPHGFRINMGAFGGTMNAAKTSKCRLTVVPDTLDFGIVKVNAIRKLSLYLKNGSPDEIHINEIFCSDSKYFRIKKWCDEEAKPEQGYLLKPGSVDSISVLFYTDQEIEQRFNETITIKTHELPPRKIKLAASTQLSTLPTGWTVLQNYPNPFNHQTVIACQLYEEKHISIKIYNLLGQEVRTLIDDRVEAGFYKLLWDGKNNSGQDVGSGIYLYKIKSGSYENCKKMVLVR